MAEGLNMGWVHVKMIIIASLRHVYYIGNDFTASNLIINIA